MNATTTDNPYVAEGFTGAEITEILYADGESTCVARSTHGYIPLSYGRAVTILGSAYVVRPGAVILAVDEEGFWTRDCCVHEITDAGTVDGVANSSARRSLRTMSSAECRFRPAIYFIVPSNPISGYRTLKLVGLIQWEHASDVEARLDEQRHDRVPDAVQMQFRQLVFAQRRPSPGDPPGEHLTHRLREDGTTRRRWATSGLSPIGYVRNVRRRRRSGGRSPWTATHPTCSRTDSEPSSRGYRQSPSL